MSEKSGYIPPEAMAESGGPVEGVRPIEGLSENLELGDDEEPKTKVLNDEGGRVETDDGPVVTWKPIEGLPENLEFGGEKTQ